MLFSATKDKIVKAITNNIAGVQAYRWREYLSPSFIQQKEDYPLGWSYDDDS